VNLTGAIVSNASRFCLFLAALLFAISTASAADRRAGSAGKAPAKTPVAAAEADEDAPPTEKVDPEVEKTQLADEQRKADAVRKRDEMERLAKEAEDERQQEATRRAEAKKKKELMRQKEEAERLAKRCVLKPVMTDAEIARCR
jgi:hypothetical protein